MDLTITRDTVAIEMAARMHRDADGPPKRAALLNRVAVQTTRRWRRERDARGSPGYRMHRYIATAPDPYRVVAHVAAEAAQAVLKDKDVLAIEAEMAERRRAVAILVGKEIAMRDDGETHRLDRAQIAERIAGHYEALAGAEVELEARIQAGAVPPRSGNDRRQP